MDILGILKGFWESSGLAVLTWREGVMILVSFVLLYLAIAKKFEPLLLLPIAFHPGAYPCQNYQTLIKPILSAEAQSSLSILYVKVFFFLSSRLSKNASA